MAEETRHGGEAYLFAIEGRGHSVIDGVRYDWSEGDLVLSITSRGTSTSTAIPS